jgi:hypothetical protein
MAWVDCSEVGKERVTATMTEGGAHIALGYSSWADYCEQEFRIGHSPQVTSQVGA